MLKRGKDAEAETSLREAIHIDPKSAAAHRNLGYLLLKRGKDAEAETSFRGSDPGSIRSPRPPTETSATCC